MSLRKIVVEAGIIAFCLWHMTAIGVALLPERTGLYSRMLTRGQNIVTPYILSLTQWQRWMIFAPDPLTRVSFFRIDHWTGETWEPVATLDYAHLPWYKREKELKILSNLEMGWHGLTPTYLNGYCHPLNIGSGHTLRLVTRYQIIPGEMAHLDHMAELQLPTDEAVLGSTVCTSA